MSEFTRYREYIGKLIGGNIYDFTDKKKNIDTLVCYMLDRTQSMFEYENLPDTIPARNIELILQCNGNTCITKVNDKLYAFYGGLGGEPDEYYMPTIYTIANPALQFNANLKINEECVVIPNDSMYTGLLPLFYKYATEMVETELSLNIANINSRIISLISAGDDRTLLAAQKYINDIIDGKLSVCGENAFLNGVRTQPYQNAHNTITDIIELLQYYKASWYNEIGLNANYNMKRESINSNESQLNNDSLLPLIDNMLTMREEGIEKVNKMYGTNISVKLKSIWEKTKVENELAADLEPIKDKMEEGVENESIEN